MLLFFFFGFDLNFIIKRQIYYKSIKWILFSIYSKRCRFEMKNRVYYIIVFLLNYFFSALRGDSVPILSSCPPSLTRFSLFMNANYYRCFVYKCTILQYVSSLVPSLSKYQTGCSRSRCSRCRSYCGYWLLLFTVYPYD